MSYQNWDTTMEMEILMTSGSRGRLPNPAVAGYHEGEAQGGGDWAQLVEEKE